MLSYISTACGPWYPGPLREKISFSYSLAISRKFLKASLDKIKVYCTWYLNHLADAEVPIGADLIRSYGLYGKAKLTSSKFIKYRLNTGVQTMLSCCPTGIETNGLVA